MQRPFYITTAINYTNGNPHIGHAYEVLMTDIIARYKRLSDYDVLFCTGTDEHGQKIANTAINEGKTSKELCDYYVEKFQNMNRQLAISNDIYIRTTDSDHEQCCQKLWQVVTEKGDIYLGEYEGWYNIKEESFVTENEAKLLDYKDNAGNPLNKTKEASYFFRMSRYQEQLINHIEEHPEFIMPESSRNSILTRLKEEPLMDLSISRTTFDWGITVPNDPKHVMYVWFDALTNYISALDYYNTVSSNKRDHWPVDVHIIGKDIVWFHAVIWSCMLFSADIPLPKTIFCHGFVNDKEGKKMSKSIGNVINPTDILDKYDSDVLRFYLAREGVFGYDFSFSEDAMIILHDAELANNYGNLVSRTINLLHKWYEGRVPECKPMSYDNNINIITNNIDEHMKLYEINLALDVIMQFIKDTNKWIAELAPWTMNDEQNDERAIIVRTLVEKLFVITHFLHPFLPKATAKVMNAFNRDFMPFHKLSHNCLQDSAPVEKIAILFKRIQDPRHVKKLNNKE